MQYFRATATALIVGVFVGCTGCDNTAATNALLSGVAAAIQNLKDTKDLVGAFAADLQQTYEPGSEDYLSSKQKYTSTKAVFDGYLTTLKVAALSGDPAPGLEGAAADANSAIADFIKDATSRIDPTVNTRRIAFGRAVHLPTRLPADLARVPLNARRDAISAAIQTVSWPPWPDDQR